MPQGLGQTLNPLQVDFNIATCRFGTEQFDLRTENRLVSGVSAEAQRDFTDAEAGTPRSGRRLLHHTRPTLRSGPVVHRFAPPGRTLGRYEPMAKHGPTALHAPGNPGPAEAETLQFPRTASSGRRLMVTIFGVSYSFFATGSLSGCFIRSYASAKSRTCSS